MDLLLLLNNVVDLNDYIELTHDLENKYKDVKITLNHSTILSVKKHRSLEIEYFNKCEGSGAALKIFERMLCSPASKTWAFIGPEVVSLIQYWLEAVRKHLISHHIHWWTFLRHLFGFIKMIKKKDCSMSNLLVEETAEVMLDLATSGKMDVIQRYETLHTFNLVCAETSREVRMALKNQFEPYFIRLATLSATCGHFPSQFAAVETLLRWLQPRQDPVTRKEAANKWLLPHLYSKATVDIFLTRNWMNFLQDARDFLNSHNDTNNLVTSVICRKLVIGETVILKMQSDDLRISWLDINSGNNSVTVILEPHHLEALGQCEVNACETLTITKDHVRGVRFYRDTNELKVSLSTVSSPVVLPSGVRVYSEHEGEVNVTISSRSNLPKVDAAFRDVFEEKYQVMLDVEDAPPLSPLRVGSGRRKNNVSLRKDGSAVQMIKAKGSDVKSQIVDRIDDENDFRAGQVKHQDERSRFSHPVKEKRRQLRSGYAVWSKRFTSLKSPSTASTGSLAQLHDKLANLPYYEFTKEPLSVCAQPELSVVNELNESQISNSLDSTSTLKLRRCAVKSFQAYIEERKSQSDNEVNRNYKNNTPDERQSENTRESQSDNEYIKRSTKQDGISSLFAATVGSTDETILGATLDRLPKHKELNTDNLIELLVQEALQSKEERILDSGINTGDGKKSQELDSETIEDTQYGHKIIRSKTPLGLKKVEPRTPKNCTIVSKSTSDESNTEAISETPVNYVNVRRRNQRRKSTITNETENAGDDQNDNFYNKDVENFFSQHFAENQMGDVVISPTLAKKINDSSSEASEGYLINNVEDNFDIPIEEDMPDLNVVECLNDMVDKVCNDFKKCTEHLDKHVSESGILDIAKNISDTMEQHFNQKPGGSPDESKDKENKKPVQITSSKGRPATKSKLTKKNRKVKSQPKKGKLIMKPVSKMSTILEDNNENDANKSAHSDIKKVSTDNETNTTIMRRKRKLYSPKDDQIEFDRNDAEEDKAIISDAAEVTSKPMVDSDDDDIALAELRKEKPVTPKLITPKPVTPKSVTSCYKEIEKERQNYRTRARRSRERKIESPLSPKTIKNNNVFEKLKNNIESSERIIFVDKKSDKDIAIFNFTSDSEDEDFKQKKMEIQKRTSTTTIGSSTSMMSTRRGRKKIDYTEDGKDSSKEANAKTTKRKRVTRRKKSKTVETEINVEAKDLIDERMREAPPELLNTSFSAEKEVEIVKEPEPIIQAPHLEMFDDDNANLETGDSKIKDVNVFPEDITKLTVKTDKKTTKIEKKVSRKRENKLKEYENNKLDIERENTGDDRTSSPLPGLIIETEKSRADMDESLNTNMVKRFEKMYTEGPGALSDTLNTQNMLSDNERPNHSPRINITEELGIDREGNTVQNISDVIDETINSEHSSKISKANSTKSKRCRLKLKKKKIDDSFTVTSDTVVNEMKISNNETATKEPKTNKTPININESQKSKKSVKSTIQEIDFNEIICVKSDIVTRSKSLAKSRSKSREIEVIGTHNTFDNSEIKSERSIATEGITGHGDMDELPPSSKLLAEKLSPREIQDMDQSIREYYVELNREVNNSKDSSVVKVEFPKHKLRNKNVKRLVEDKKSEPSSGSIAKIKCAGFEDRDYEIANMLPSRRDTDSECSSQGSKMGSPVVSATRLTPKYLARWSTKTTPQSSFESSKESSKPTTFKRVLRSFSKTSKNRKSLISPITLDDFLSKSEIPRNYKFQDTANTQSLKTTTEDVPKNSSASRNQRYFLRPSHESSPISKAEKSEESTPKVSLKRKRPIAETMETKTMKHDEQFRIETVDISGSRQSSNVDDWLRKMSNLSRVEDNFNDSLQNIIEKLDTTLVEIHQNTTKDFISLFVEAQKQLVEMKEARRNSYRESAVTILTEVTQLLDRQFCEMDRQAEARDNQFMSWLKERAGEVLRRDCKQKRAMVSLIREDVQAAAEQIRPDSDDD